jgi:hypothetical protein
MRKCLAMIVICFILRGNRGQIARIKVSPVKNCNIFALQSVARSIGPPNCCQFFLPDSVIEVIEKILALII